jgi:hypothetical protein
VPEDGVPKVSRLTWPGRRAVVMAVSMATVFSACASSHPAQLIAGSAPAKGQQSVQTTTRVSTQDEPACTESDLTRPGPAAMPASFRLAAVESFPTATVTLSPPAPTDNPSVSPQLAWDNAWTDKRSDVRYEVVLARMAAQFPATMGAGTSTTPLYDGVLVWAVVTHRMPSVPVGGPPLAQGETRRPGPACYWADELDLTDATTGQRMFSATFGSGT